MRPFLSVITATPQEYISDILSDLEVAGGFLNRCLIISGEEQPAKAIVTTPTDDAWDGMAMHLQKACDAAPSGNIEFDNAALALWKDFYDDWKNKRRTMKVRDAQLTARVFEHILKIAIVFAVLDREPKISKATLDTAIAIGRWLQSNVVKLFEAVGMDRAGRCEYLILDLLLRAPGRRMWKRDLQRAVSGRGYSAEVFNRALRALEISDRIDCSEEQTMAGRNRILVEYAK